MTPSSQAGHPSPIKLLRAPCSGLRWVACVLRISTRGIFLCFSRPEVKTPDRPTRLEQREIVLSLAALFVSTSEPARMRKLQHLQPSILPNKAGPLPDAPCLPPHVRHRRALTRARIHAIVGPIAPSVRDKASTVQIRDVVFMRVEYDGVH